MAIMRRPTPRHRANRPRPDGEPDRRAGAAPPHLGAATSLREGLDEILAVLRLSAPPTLARSLRSNSCIEGTKSVATTPITSNTGGTGRWRCAGAPLGWSKPASSCATSTVTYIPGRCAPRSSGMSPSKMSQPDPDDHTSNTG